MSDCPWRGQSVLLCTELSSVSIESDLWLQQYEQKVAEVVMYACNPSIRRWRLKDPMFSHLWLHRKYEASLNLRLCLKKKIIKTFKRQSHHGVGRGREAREMAQQVKMLATQAR